MVARRLGASAPRERSERHVEPDARELVRALLGAAGTEEQEVAVLYFVDELTQAEIAEATGRSLPTVRKRLRDFLAAARGALREAFPDITLPEPEELPSRPADCAGEQWSIPPLQVPTPPNREPRGRLQAT